MLNPCELTVIHLSSSLGCQRLRSENSIWFRIEGSVRGKSHPLIISFCFKELLGHRCRISGERGNGDLFAPTRAHAPQADLPVDVPGGGGLCAGQSQVVVDLMEFVQK